MKRKLLSKVLSFVFVGWVAFATSAQAQVVINEVMSQNTTTPSSCGTTSDWIEIFNPGVTPFNLTGYRLLDNTNIYVIPNIPAATVSAGGYVVFCANNGNNGLNTNFAISAGGETITLQAPNFALVNQLIVPAMAANSSYIRFPNGVGAGQITTSPTPGAANTSSSTPNNPAAAALRINEVVSSNVALTGPGAVPYGNAPNLYPDLIEIYNTSSTAVSMANLNIADSGGLYTFPSTSTLIVPANGFLLLLATGNAPIAANEVPFGLSASGETVTLYNADGVTVIHTEPVPALATDKSWGAYPDGSGIFGNISVPTPGGPNNLPGAPPIPGAQNLVLNEVLSNNVSGLLTAGGTNAPALEDWFEIVNNGTTSVTLTGLQFSDQTAGIGSIWSVPATTPPIVLGAGQRIVIFASGENAAYSVGASFELHTNFNISSTLGETLTMIDADGSILQSTNVPPESADIAWARIPDISGVFQNSTSPTPNAINANVPITPNPNANLIVMNEIASANSTILTSVSGGHPDYVELFNTSSTVTVNMAGLKLQDSTTTWAFPAGVTMAPLSYRVIYLDNSPTVVGPGELFTGFGLAQAGETLKFLNLDNSNVGLVNVPALFPDQVYQRLPNGTGPYSNAWSATPGAANSNVVPAPNTLAAANITINEVSSDAQTFFDEDGTAQDWIELYNKGTQLVNIGGLKLRDATDMWTFPSPTYIAPGQYKIVWASSKNRKVANQPLHTNFKCESNGEVLDLLNTDFTPIDALNVPMQLSDQSYGRFANGTGSYQIFTTPTFMASNSISSPSQLTAPAANSTFAATTQVFNWTSAVGANQYYLDVASNPSLLNTRARGDIFTGNLGTALTATVLNIPLNGNPVYAAVWSRFGNLWLRSSLVTYQTQSLGVAAQITFPSNNEVLANTFKSFSWDLGVGATQYWFDLATSSVLLNTRGAGDIYTGNQGTSNSVHITTIPQIGNLVYASAWSLTGGVWQRSAVKQYFTATPVTGGFSEIGRYTSGLFSTTGAGIARQVAYDKQSSRLFITNNNQNRLEIVDITNPSTPVFVATVALPVGTDANAIDARGNGVVAVASKSTSPGTVIFYNQNGVLLNTVIVGFSPDYVKFSPDGTKLLVANEGNPVGATDPNGSISIINVSGPITALTAANVATVDFTSFNGTTLPAGVRVFGAGTIAQQFEPESIAFLPNSSKAKIILQENNAEVTLNLTTNLFENLHSLGSADNAKILLDAQDNSAVGIRTWPGLPIKGLRLPRVNDMFLMKNTPFFVTVNEGESRIAEVSTVTGALANLDPIAFPTTSLSSLTLLGNLKISGVLGTGDIDADGDIDELQVFGSRSFSIWDQNGNLVYDSSDDIEHITASAFPTQFNSDNNSNTSFDLRSDDRGPEPTSLTTGIVYKILGLPSNSAAANDVLIPPATGQGDIQLEAIVPFTYVFVGLEKIGGIAAFDVSNPFAPQFIQYTNNRNFAVPMSAAAGDIYTSDLTFIPASDNPSGQDLLVATFAYSGTTVIYKVY